MKLFYKPIVIKQLRKLPLSEKKKVVKKLVLLSRNPRAGKPLRGELTGLNSLRAWPYRIVYRLDKTAITVFSVSHRQSAYR